MSVLSNSNNYYNQADCEKEEGDEGNGNRLYVRPSRVFKQEVRFYLFFYTTHTIKTCTVVPPPPLPSPLIPLLPILPPVSKSQIRVL